MKKKKQNKPRYFVFAEGEWYGKGPFQFDSPRKALDFYLSGKAFKHYEKPCYLSREIFLEPSINKKNEKISFHLHEGNIKECNEQYYLIRNYIGSRSYYDGSSDPIDCYEIKRFENPSSLLNAINDSKHLGSVILTKGIEVKLSINNAGEEK